MFKNFMKNVFLRFLRPLPRIAEDTLISEILSHYPAFDVFLRSRCAIEVSKEDRALTFIAFAREHSLPPPQILFMQFQMEERSRARFISAPELKLWMDSDQKPVVLDVRESWELEWGTLPGSRPFDRKLMDEALKTWPKDTPLAFYCHFGVRSLDAAVYLADCGFENVRVLEGGVEAWSSHVDPDFPKYPGHPC